MSYITTLALKYILLERYIFRYNATYKLTKQTRKTMKTNKLDKTLIDNFYNKIQTKEFDEIFAISYPIAIIQKVIFSRGETFLKENYGLLNSEVDVLSLLYTNNKALTPTQLYDLTIFSSGGMTKVLKRLEDRGLIHREAKQNDKRCVLVSLSQKGKELVKTSLDAVSKECYSYFKALKKDEQKTLATLLKKVLDSL